MKLVWPKDSFRYFLPTFQDLIFLAIFFLALLFGSAMMNVDGDIGRHLTIGHFILDSGNIPTTDFFSHTKFGESLTPHEWLAQTLFALSERLAKLDGIIWITAGVLGLCFAILYRLMRIVGGGIIESLFLVLLSAAASSLHWLTRPHIFTFLLLILWIYVLELIRKGSKSAWLFLPVVMFFWVNLHGAFIAGFLMIFLYLIGSFLEKILSQNQDGYKRLDSLENRYYLAGGLISFLVTFLNPVGFNIWKTSLGYIQNRYLVGHTAEYLPPDFQDMSTWPFLVMILLSIFILGVFRPKIPVVHIFSITVWTALALFSTRNIPLYTISAAPGLVLALGSVNILGRNLKLINSRLRSFDSQLVGGILPSLVLVISAVVFMQNPGNPYIAHFSEKAFPVNAANWINKNDIQGNMFNYFPWGGYLLYSHWPDYLVFIDGQTDFYGEDLTKEYEEVITGGDEWSEIIHKYEIDWFIIPVNSKLDTLLRESEIWKERYQDSTAVIYQLDNK